MTRKTRQTVMGVQAPPPRPTRAGALWLACVLAVPVGVLLAVVEMAWRLLG